MARKKGVIWFITYIPVEIVKYSILVKMVGKSASECICNFEIYIMKGKEVEETILSVLGCIKLAVFKGTTPSKDTICHP